MRERDDDAARSQAARRVYPAPGVPKRTSMYRNGPACTDNGPGRPSPATRDALGVKRGAQPASAIRAGANRSGAHQQSDTVRQAAGHPHSRSSATRRSLSRWAPCSSSRTSAIVLDVRSSLNPANASGAATGEARRPWSRSGPYPLPHQDFAALALAAPGPAAPAASGAAWGNRHRRTQPTTRPRSSPNLPKGRTEQEPGDRGVGPEAEPEADPGTAAAEADVHIREAPVRRGRLAALGAGRVGRADRMGRTERWERAR